MSQQQRKPRILFLRSYTQPTFAAFIAGGLHHSQQFDFMQYPPASRSRWDKLEKLYDPAAGWEDINRNLILSRKELKEKLTAGYFDLVLLMDYDARLFEYLHMGTLKRLRNLLGQGKKLFKDRFSDIVREGSYMHGSPLTLAEINARTPVAAVDFNDWICLALGDQRILQDSSFYFKRELPFNRFFLYYQNRPAPWSDWRRKLSPVLDKVCNVPLGIEDKKYFQLKKLRKKDQDIDVFYCGEGTSTPRLKVVQLLQEMALSSSLNIVIDERLSFKEYCRKIARSKITLSISGGGWDCFRHYEATALGSLPFIDRPGVDAVWWQSLPDEIFFESTLTHFKGQLEKLLLDDRRRKIYFKQLEKQVESYMLHSKIVEYMVYTCLSQKT